MKDLILASFSFVTSIFLVILFVLLGWYIVWKLILYRFRFFRELVRGAEDDTVTELKTSRSKVKRTRKD